MTSTEPVTMLTDLILAVACSVFAYLLFASGRNRRQIALLLWSAAFAATAVGAVAGGVYHGVDLSYSPYAQLALWKVVLYATGAAGFAMVAATVFAAARGWLHRVLLAAAGAKWLVYTVWVSVHNAFRYAIYDYTVALIAVLLLNIYLTYQGRDASTRWTGLGVLMSLAAATVQHSGLDLHRYFNHNDLYHLIQLAGLYLLFRGASLVTDRR